MSHAAPRRRWSLRQCFEKLFEHGRSQPSCLLFAPPPASRSWGAIAEAPAGRIGSYGDISTGTCMGPAWHTPMWRLLWYLGGGGGTAPTHASASRHRVPWCCDIFVGAFTGIYLMGTLLPSRMVAPPPSGQPSWLFSETCCLAASTHAKRHARPLCPHSALAFLGSSSEFMVI